MAINSSKWSFRDSLRRFADVRRSPAINGVKIAWRSTDRLFRWQDSPTLRMVSAIAGWYRRRPPRVRSALALAPIVNTPAAYYYFSLAHQQNNFGDMLHQMVQHPEQAVPLIMAIGANLFGAKYSAFRERALLDPLTGVLRADVFHSRMGRALKGLGRRGRTASVAFFDLDNFKTINDTLGHGHGDNILRIFSRHLREWVRSNDIVGRTGGDEFEVVFPKITKEDLDRRAGQIREQMQKSVREYIAEQAHQLGADKLRALEERPFDVSIGLYHNVPAGTHPEKVRSVAEANMYGVKREKRQGKRRQ